MKALVEANGRRRTVECDKFEEGECGLILLNQDGERSGYVPLDHVVSVEPDDSVTERPFVGSGREPSETDRVDLSDDGTVGVEGDATVDVAGDATIDVAGDATIDVEGTAGAGGPGGEADDDDGGGDDEDGDDEDGDDDTDDDGDGDDEDGLLY